MREVGDQVLFLHRLEPGGADRSYGIEVGRLAGLPPTVLKRAKELLKLLEAEQIVPRSGHALPTPSSATDDQLALFGMMTHPVVEQLRTTEPNNMTPIQALELLARLVMEREKKRREVSSDFESSFYRPRTGFAAACTREDDQFSLSDCGRSDGSVIATRIPFRYPPALSPQSAGTVTLRI